MLTIFYLFTEIEVKSFVNLHILIDYLQHQLNGRVCILSFHLILFIRIFHVIMCFRNCYFESISSTHTHTEEENIINLAHLSPRLNNYPHFVTITSSLSFLSLWWKHLKANPRHCDILPFHP